MEREVRQLWRAPQFKSEAAYLATLSTARHVIEKKWVGWLRELSFKGRRVDEVMRSCASEVVVGVRGMAGPSHRRGASPYIPRPQSASRTTDHEPRAIRA